MTDSDSKKVNRIDILCQKAKSKWGMRLQFIVAIEELAELIQELTKHIRLKDTNNTLSWDNWDGEILDSLIDEIADVEIMLYQLKWFYNMFADVFHAKNRKLDRLEKRLEDV